MKSKESPPAFSSNRERRKKVFGLKSEMNPITDAPETKVVKEKINQKRKFKPSEHLLPVLVFIVT